MPNNDRKKQYQQNQADNRPNDYLLVEDVAALLKVQPAEVTNWAENSEIPHYRLPGNTIRIHRRDLDAWIAGRKVNSGVAATAPAAITIMRPQGKKRRGNAKSIGYRAHMMRTMNGLPVTLIADVLGIKKWQEWDRYERGQKVFDEPLITKTAKLFGLRKPWLMEGSGFFTDEKIIYFRMGYRTIQTQHEINYAKTTKAYLPQIAQDMSNGCILRVPDGSFMVKDGHLWQAGITTILLLTDEDTGNSVVITTNMPRIGEAIAQTIGTIEDVENFDMGVIKNNKLPIALLNGRTDAPACREIRAFMRIPQP